MDEKFEAISKDNGTDLYSETRLEVKNESDGHMLKLILQKPKGLPEGPHPCTEIVMEVEQ